MIKNQNLGSSDDPKGNVRFCLREGGREGRKERASRKKIGGVLVAKEASPAFPSDCLENQQ